MHTKFLTAMQENISDSAQFLQLVNTLLVPNLQLYYQYASGYWSKTSTLKSLRNTTFSEFVKVIITLLFFLPKFLVGTTS